MKRTTEFVLGLIGGIFGLIGAVMAIFVGVLDEAFSGSTEISGLGWSAVLLSILGIVGSVIVKRKPKLGGAFMTIAAIGGTISIFVFYILPGVLLFIGGIMGLFRKDKTKSVEA
ncbi:DUF4064 domain-containing protein [Metabacillus sediminilitoris]|uniref:DUF4064 domain-containing protein n=1 Tax=Metabacillus sediminilitoris TaxID=2567941 RepID=A0A4S4BHN3_9BACI|nr:DUF4064 domain-containing protein [Metabacillus sediminilitoris]QGQ46626.1 DUF4064 domain-containing protein [Metabacillus sediminilitoris]THF74028.1 DUF4064 domain-containing protein [Metabacillus sediminilitoris]